MYEPFSQSNHCVCLARQHIRDIDLSLCCLPIDAVLETAGRIVAKCDQKLVWATKFFPKDRPENEFGRPNLGRGYRMFSAYLRSISEINIFKTDQRNYPDPEELEAITSFFFRRRLPLY